MPVSQAFAESNRSQTERLRRLVRTLTAQGRMARWILTGLPVFVTVFLFIFHPDVMKNFFASGIGQVLLLIGDLLLK